MRINYYNDELNDDFAEDKDKINPIKIDENYKYIHKNLLWNITAIILYRIIFSIPVYIHTKIKYKFEIVNKEALKKEKKNGYFIYGNHTNEFIDPFFPTFITFPKRVYVIANADNVSIPGLKTAIRMLGALPVPDNIKASKNFFKAIKYYINKNRVIAIYPEAHVWPFYTKIRNYKSVSFKYPIELDKPVYSFTTTYQQFENNKRKKDNTGKKDNKYDTIKTNNMNDEVIKNEIGPKEALKKDKIKIVTYVDGPFYPDKTLNKKEAQEKLRNEVYEAMNNRSKNNNIEIIKYVKRGKND